MQIKSQYYWVEIHIKSMSTKFRYLRAQHRSNVIERERAKTQFTKIVCPKPQYENNRRWTAYCLHGNITVCILWFPNSFLYNKHSACHLQAKEAGITTTEGIFTNFRFSLNIKIHVSSYFQVYMLFNMLWLWNCNWWLNIRIEIKVMKRGTSTLVPIPVPWIRYWYQCWFKCEWYQTLQMFLHSYDLFAAALLRGCRCGKRRGCTW